jgi:GxxExxY protein
VEINEVAKRTMDAAFRVHRELGPGLLESAYEKCLAFELARTGLRSRRQVTVPIMYDGHRLDAGYRLDLLVEECLVVEVKAVEALAPIHTAQVLTYLRLGSFHVALMFNFNSTLLKDGIRRLVWKYPGPPTQSRTPATHPKAPGP